MTATTPRNLPTLLAQDALLAEYGKAAVDRGLSAWKQGVIEPGRKAFHDPSFDDDRAFINTTIKSEQDGLGWSRCSVLTADFRWDGDFEWCGAFGAAYCWNVLRPGIRKHYAASTYRLFRYARYLSPPNKFASYLKAPPASTIPRKYVEFVGQRVPMDKVIVSRQLQEFGPRPGDVFVVGGSDRYGQHIVVFRSVDYALQVIHTVEGNATGEGPDGERYQGVITRTRSFSELRHAYRPGYADVVEGLL